MNQRPVVAYSSQLGMLLGFLGVSLILSGLLLSWLSSLVLEVPLMQAGDALLRPENVQFSRFANAFANVPHKTPPAPVITTVFIYLFFII